MDVFDSLHSELQFRKIVKRERRGYTAGPIAWQSHKNQKYACTSCKRTFPRMEVLLQHFRDSSKHSQQAISREASIQMANWLLAKDQRLHCCPTCCLGFQSEAELFVHLKHTEVHEGTSEAKQASALLLPKDEARLLRRNLQRPPLATLQASPAPQLQQSSQVPQSASGLQSSLTTLPDKPGKATAKCGQEQESLQQRHGSNQHSSASANDPGSLMQIGCAGQTAAAADATTHECPQTSRPESQHGAEHSRQEPAGGQDDLKGHSVANPVANPEKHMGPTRGCSRFHVDSLKILQRRIVARKRKRRSISAADTEGTGSAASSGRVAIMAFMEPCSKQAAGSIEDQPQAKQQCQQSSGQPEPGIKCF